MTDVEMLVKVKCLITPLSLSNVSDDTLSVLIAQSKSEICNYLNTSYDTKYDYLCIDMVIYRYNRLGSEGMTAQSYSGASETYLSEYPDYVIRQLNSFKKKWGAL